MKLSKCCKAKVKVVGKVTKHYRCEHCKQQTDLMSVKKDRLRRQAEKWISTQRAGWVYATNSISSLTFLLKRIDSRARREQRKRDADTAFSFGIGDGRLLNRAMAGQLISVAILRDKEQ